MQLSAFSPAGIDWYRQRKHTAINQSSTSIPKGGRRFTLDGRVEVEGGRVTITDTTDTEGIALRPQLVGEDGLTLTAPEIAPGRSVSLQKTVDTLSGRIEIVLR